MDRLKIFPEKLYELARSYELAPFDLAQHPCMKFLRYESFDFI